MYVDAYLKQTLHFNFPSWPHSQALKYSEFYDEALQNFKYASRLDPPWEPPKQELTRLMTFVSSAHALVKTRGKLKGKRLANMVQVSMSNKPGCCGFVDTKLCYSKEVLMVDRHCYYLFILHFHEIFSCLRKHH